MHFSSFVVHHVLHPLLACATDSFVFTVIIFLVGSRQRLNNFAQSLTRARLLAHTLLQSMVYHVVTMGISQAVGEGTNPVTDPNYLHVVCIAKLCALSLELSEFQLLSTYPVAGHC